MVSPGVAPLGRVVWSSAPFHSTGSASVAAGMVNPLPEALKACTEYAYDDLGRTVSESLIGLDLEDKEYVASVTSYGYAGNASSVVGPSGQVSVSVSDVRGRMAAQYQLPTASTELDEGLETTYAYGTVAGGSTVTVSDPEGYATVFASNVGGQRTESPRV